MGESRDLLVTQGRDGHRLLQVGGLLFLLGLVVGLGVPKFTVPRLALSTHLLGITQGTFLTRATSGMGRVLATYGCLAAWTANLLGAVWGAGASMVPMAAGAARGTPLQETTIRVLLISAAVSLVCVAVLILWGLRAAPPADSGAQ